MTRADSVDTTRRQFTPKIIAGTDFAAPLSGASAAVPMQVKPPGFEPVIDVDKSSAETLTHKNKRLRDARREVWRDADAVRSYWCARLKFDDAVSTVQRHDLPEGSNHPPHDPKERWTIVANCRAAVVAQLLTPAPDVAALTWKRAALKGGQHKFTDVKSERIERAIADDVMWLAAHPFRIKAGRQ